MVGDTHLKNRVVFGPQVTNLGERRALSDRHVAYLGITQRTDVVPIAVAEHDGRLTLTLTHHPTGTDKHVACDWIVCAVQQQPDRSLWQDLNAADVELHQIGDCLEPRRAHSAVIEGERVGAAL